MPPYNILVFLQISTHSVHMLSGAQVFTGAVYAHACTGLIQTQAIKRTSLWFSLHFVYDVSMGLNSCRGSVCVLHFMQFSPESPEAVVVLTAVQEREVALPGPATAELRFMPGRGHTGLVLPRPVPLRYYQHRAS